MRQIPCALPLRIPATSFFCNTFQFLTLDNPEFHSARKGLMKWKEYVNAFGLGHRLGVDLPSEDIGNIPDTATYDKELYNQAGIHVRWLPWASDKIRFL